MLGLVIGGIHVGDKTDSGSLWLVARQTGGEVAVFVQGDLGQPKGFHLFLENTGKDQLAFTAGTGGIGLVRAGMKSHVTQETLKQGIHYWPPVMKGHCGQSRFLAHCVSAGFLHFLCRGVTP